MKVLITGSNGFIGKNIISALEYMENISIITFSKNNTFRELECSVCEADFILHLAGINRPNQEEEFYEGNVFLTKKIAELLIQYNKKTPVVFASSIQAELNNPYGNSKREAEDVLKNCALKNGNHIYIFRLANVFGKWCKVNYNSVVSTFCYNIARNIPISISDEKKELNLIYIDDVVHCIVKLLEKPCCDGIIYCDVKPEYKCTLKELAEILMSFKRSQESKMIPGFEIELVKKLYAVYTYYMDNLGRQYVLDKKEDNRGWLAEFVKDSRFGQIFISTTKPGITRGNHWHHTKSEKFLVVHGKARILIKDLFSAEIIEYIVDGKELKVIDIPTGYVHSITNIGEDELITIFYSNEIFDPDNPDTYQKGCCCESVKSNDNCGDKT